MSVHILILGAGWLSTFLVPLCRERGLAFAATTRDGRDETLPFVFDPREDMEEVKLKCEHLPDATTVLITFRITESGGPTNLVRAYLASRKLEIQPSFILLGSTGIWPGKDPENGFQRYDRHSPYAQQPRATAEEELLKLSPAVPTTVLNLSGLWGGSRSPRNWIEKVRTKEALKEKGSLHVIHGLDVSRAILAVHTNFPKAVGERWILTDGRVHDWWEFASGWGHRPPPGEIRRTDDPDPQARWMRELMRECNIKALPRDVELLGRALDSREFWETFELNPLHLNPKV
ncbi:hypothetical protein APHAL10511_008091 [Amanita phalloides]|nr:hypothetical protein APHAL10511_008091 [Amanita phalloides]